MAGEKFGGRIKKSITCPICKKEKYKNDLATGTTICRKCYNKQKRSDAQKYQDRIRKLEGGWISLPGYPMYLVNELGDIKGSLSGVPVGYSYETVLMQGTTVTNLASSQRQVIKRAAETRKKREAEAKEDGKVLRGSRLTFGESLIIYREEEVTQVNISLEKHSRIFTRDALKEIWKQTQKGNKVDPDAYSRPFEHRWSNVLDDIKRGYEGEEEYDEQYDSYLTDSM